MRFTRNITKKMILRLPQRLAATHAIATNLQSANATSATATGLLVPLWALPQSPTLRHTPTREWRKTTTRTTSFELISSLRLGSRQVPGQVIVIHAITMNLKASTTSGSAAWRLVLATLHITPGQRQRKTLRTSKRRRQPGILLRFLDFQRNWPSAISIGVRRPPRATKNRLAW